MYLSFLKSKIQRAIVPGFELHYEGSISIDFDYMEKVEIFKNEKFNVLNLNNESWTSTYVRAAEINLNKICVNCTTARTAQAGA